MSDVITADAILEGDGLPVLTKADIREQWVAGSIPQLRHSFSGRCVTCDWWTPNDLGNHGTCSEMGKARTDGLVDVGRIQPVTRAEFGCILWKEIGPTIVRDEDGAAVMEPDGNGGLKPVLEGVEESHAAIKARTEHAISAGLIDDVPETEA